jgi:hypothetical protein
MCVHARLPTSGKLSVVATIILYNGYMYVCPCVSLCDSKEREEEVEPGDKLTCTQG